MENADGATGAQRYYGIIPLLHFEPEWAATRYDIEPMVHLVRASEDNLLQLMDYWDEHSRNWVGDYGQIIVRDIKGAREYCSWLALVPAFTEARLLAHSEFEPADDDESWEEVRRWSLDFSIQLRGVFHSNFILALDLVAASGHFAPCLLVGKCRLAENRLEIERCEGVVEEDIPGDELWRPRNTVWTRDFTETDVAVLQQTWCALADLQGIHKWAKNLCDEAFIGRMDAAASVRVKAYLRQNPGEEAKQQGLHDRFWKEECQKAWRKPKEHTRLARAFKEFRDGLAFSDARDSLLHMTTCLEVLYAFERTGAGIADRIGRRLAHMLAEDEARQELYRKEVSEVYEARSARRKAPNRQCGLTEA